jgi:hypothetical protein
MREPLWLLTACSLLQVLIGPLPLFPELAQDFLRGEIQGVHHGQDPGAHLAHGARGVSLEALFRGPTAPSSGESIGDPLAAAESPRQPLSLMKGLVGASRSSAQGGMGRPMLT